MADYYQAFVHLAGQVDTVLEQLTAVRAEAEEQLLREADGTVYEIRLTKKMAETCDQLTEIAGYGRDEVVEVVLRLGFASLMTLSQLLVSGQITLEQLKQKLAEPADQAATDGD